MHGGHCFASAAFVIEETKLSSGRFECRAVDAALAKLAASVTDERACPILGSFRGMDHFLPALRQQVDRVLQLG
jgi:hypothetical protein